MSCWSGVIASQDPTSPLWSPQIKNTAPFAFQPYLVCKIPQLEKCRRGIIILITVVMLQMG